MSNKPRKTHPKLPAEIVETPDRSNGHCYIVETDCGRTLNLRGLGAPKGGKLGDRGTVQYQTGAGFGLYFWQSLNKEE